MTGYLHAAQTVRGLLPVPAGERVAVEHESVDLVLYGMRTAAVVKGRLRSASDQVGEFETVLALPVQASSIQAKRYSPTRAPRRRELVATAHRNLPVKLATDYAAATGDWTPVHFDIAAARELGLRGVVMHGMCVLGIASETAIELVGTRDLIVRDVSARFSRPVEPGQQLSVSVYATDSRDTFAVGVASRDGAVLKDAWLTLAALRT